MDSYLSDGGFDDDDEGGQGDDDYEDDWSDEDDDAPPDFDEDDEPVKIGLSKPSKQADYSAKKEKEMLVPTLPDGRPRERW